MEVLSARLELIFGAEVTFLPVARLLFVLTANVQKTVNLKHPSAAAWQHFPNDLQSHACLSLSLAWEVSNVWAVQNTGWPILDSIPSGQSLHTGLLS